MKTIELIKKLFELAQLVEDFQIGNVTETSWYDRRTFAYQDVNKFKSKVRTVAGKIARDFDFLKHFYKIDTYDSCYLDLSFDDLFKTLLESASKQEKFFCLSAICHKMGVELESEEQ